MSFWNPSITHGFHPGGSPSVLRGHWVCQCGLYNTTDKVSTSYLETSVHRMVHRALARSSIQDAQSAINLGAVNKRQGPIGACDIIGNLSFK